MEVPFKCKTDDGSIHLTFPILVRYRAILGWALLMLQPMDRDVLSLLPAGLWLLSIRGGKSEDDCTRVNGGWL